MFSVIFDMDGVILDTEQTVIDCWVLLAPQFGIEDIDYLKETCRKCIGTNSARTREIFLEAYGENFDYDTYRVATDNLIHEKIDREGIPVKEGARLLLEYLKNQGVSIGLASSTKAVSIQRELEQAGLYHYFDVIVGGDMVSRSKPAPDIYLTACEHMGIEPEEAYAIEDSFNGVIAASAAGMKVLMVPDLLAPGAQIRELCVDVFENLSCVQNYLEERFKEEEANRRLVRVIPEKQYKERMREQVEPSLVEYLTDGYCTTAPGISIHYQYYEKKGDFKGTVVISHGFTESALKFHEMAYYFFQMGYQVFLVDHRGHGSSTHEVDNPSVVHIRKFEDYVNDLHQVILQKVSLMRQDKPLYLYGHSMGGAISAMYIQDHPQVFEKCILNAPMIAANTGKYPRWMATLMADFGVLTGQGKRMPFMYQNYTAEADTFEAAPDTCRARFEYYRELRQRDTRLLTWSPSYAWVKTSLGVTKKLLQQSRCDKVTIPVLLFQAENDSLVMSEEQKNFIQRIPDGKLVPMPGTKHEIYFSTDDVMEQYLERIFTFLEG